MMRACLAGGALLMLAFAGGLSAAGPMRIGILAPMAGDLQAYGPAALNGARLAADEINAAGGVHGHELTLIPGDTRSEPGPGVDAARQLVSVDNVNALVGAHASDVTVEVAREVSRVEGVPQVSAASTSPVITGLEDGDFLFRTVPSESFQGVALAQIAHEAGYDVVGVIHVGNGYGVGIAEAFETAFIKRGGRITAIAAYDMGRLAYRDELQRVADGDPQALVLIGYPENGQTIVHQALEGGYFEHFVFSGGLRAPEMLAGFGADLLENAIGTAPTPRPDNPGAAHFRAAYRDAYGDRMPLPFVDSAYDAVYLLALASVKVGSTGRTAIRDALRTVASPPGEVVRPGEFARASALLAAREEINYEGASGSVDLDENGDVPGTFAEWAVVNGEIVTRRVFEPAR